MIRALLLLIATLLFATAALAQAAAPTDSAATVPPAAAAPPAETATPEAAEPMTKMVSGPPTELKKLDMLLGSWTSKAHSYAGPNGPAKDYTGKTTYKTAFDGMHLEGDHRFEMAGKPEFGRSTWGWDPERKQYQIIWTASSFPASYVYYGAFSNDTTLVVYGTYMLHGKAVTDKMTYTFSGKNAFAFQVESDMSGTMQTTLEETDKRAAATKGSTGKSATPAKKSTGASTTKKSG